MLLELHVAILLGQDGSCRWKCRKGLLNQLRIGNFLAAKSELSYDSMKLRVERDKVGEVQHPQVDPVRASLREKKGFVDDGIAREVAPTNQQDHRPPDIAVVTHDRDVGVGVTGLATYRQLECCLRH